MAPADHLPDYEHDTDQGHRPASVETQFEQRPDYYLKNLRTMAENNVTEHDPQMAAVVEGKRQQLEEKWSERQEWQMQQERRERMMENLAAAGIEKLHQVELFRSWDNLFEYNKKDTNPALFAGGEAMEVMRRILADMPDRNLVDVDFKEGRDENGAESYIRRQVLLSGDARVQLVETIVKDVGTEVTHAKLVASKQQVADIANASDTAGQADTDFPQAA